MAIVDWARSKYNGEFCYTEYAAKRDGHTLRALDIPVLHLSVDNNTNTVLVVDQQSHPGAKDEQRYSISLERKLRSGNQAFPLGQSCCTLQLPVLEGGAPDSDDLCCETLVSWSSAKERRAFSATVREKAGA